MVIGDSSMESEPILKGFMPSPYGHELPTDELSLASRDPSLDSVELGTGTKV